MKVLTRSVEEGKLPLRNVAFHLFWNIHRVDGASTFKHCFFWIKNSNRPKRTLWWKPFKAMPDSISYKCQTDCWIEKKIQFGQRLKFSTASSQYSKQQMTPSIKNQPLEIFQKQPEGQWTIGSEFVETKNDYQVFSSNLIENILMF